MPDDSLLPHEFAASFTFASMRLECEALEAISLPDYSGSAFRGVFGHAFRDAVCVARNTGCAECPIALRCAYSVVFEGTGKRPESLYRKVSDPPRPFILRPPDLHSLKVGEQFSFHLSLVGQSIEEAPWVIQAMARAGERGVGQGRGRFRLLKARDAFAEEFSPTAAAGNALQPLYEDGRLYGMPQAHSALDIPSLHCAESVQIEFLTPTRLKSDGALSDSLPFDLLIRSLLRRTAQLAAWYGPGTLDIDFKNWIERAGQVRMEREDLKWRDWTRHSARQQATMQLGGLTGTAVYRGPVAPFRQLLALGQIIHAGKGATFGLGCYRIKESQ